MAPRFQIQTLTFKTGALTSTHVGARAYTRGMTALTTGARRGVDANHDALAERCAR